MEFEEFVKLYKTEYLSRYPGVIGIMIKNWMYADWMATYHSDEWHKRLVQLEEDMKDYERWRKEV